MTPTEYIATWQARLRLGDWTIRWAKGVEPEEDERSRVDIHPDIRQAVVLLRSDTPASQIERQVVHEMLHIRLAGVYRAFDEAKEWTPKATDHALDAMWRNGEEAAIEALCDALGCAPRADWGADQHPFSAAYPP